jgi:UDP-3-O-[3-hydroxymyristoyl] glucosamine N-acyltransferase
VLLGELARVLGLALDGDPDLDLRGVASVDDATAETLCFVHDVSHVSRLHASAARAVVAPLSLDVGGRSALRSADPRADFSRAAKLLAPAPRRSAGVHPSAHVARTATIDATVSVGPLCSLGEGAVVGPGSVLHAGVVLDDGVRVGADCVLHARCVVTAGSTLGDRVVLEAGVVIGGAGFGYTGRPEGGLEKVHDVGSVVVGDDVEIGANSCVDRGTLGDTRIGRGTKIDDLVMIGHNCAVGESVVIVAQAGLAGSTVVEDGAVVLAQAGVAGHLTIGAGAVVGAQSGVHRDVPAGSSVLGTPERPGRRFHKEMAALRHLPDLLQRVRALEAGRGGTDDESGD